VVATQEEGMDMTEDPTVAWRGIRKRIADAEAAAGRAPGAVELVAVTKTFGAEAIEPLLAAAQRVFGENRVQEAAAKWPQLKERYAGIELHLIGPLQSNKAADAVRLFDVVESVDREKIAAALSHEMARQGRRLACFVQVNTGKEKQKAGIAPENAVDFVRACRERHGLDIRGLMCIPPFDEDPSPHFEMLARLAGEAGVAGLSMGMSADFEIAVARGATHVRVGSALFGGRPAA
jgi:pyridoxal phosphate enzyme (YggS family)